MAQHIRSLYKRFRKAGYRASEAITNTKILDKWEDLEADGMVRIIALAEDESYFDVFGKPDSERDRKRIVEEIELNGCWVVVSQVYNDETDKWEWYDSIGMCTGYNDPTSPFEN